MQKSYKTTVFALLTVMVLAAQSQIFAQISTHSLVAKDATPASKSTKSNRLALVSKSSGKCMQINASQAEPMVMICIDKQAEQRFDFGLSDSGKTLVKDSAGRCLQLVKLDASQNSEGDLAKVVFSYCVNNSLQEWAFTGEGILRNENNKCLDLLGGLSAEGSKIGAYKCHGGANQSWTAR
jgi:LAS superfamily LD-carboxypeptidase LdcB